MERMKRVGAGVDWDTVGDALSLLVAVLIAYRIFTGGELYWTSGVWILIFVGVSVLENRRLRRG